MQAVSIALPFSWARRCWLSQRLSGSALGQQVMAVVDISGNSRIIQRKFLNIVLSIPKDVPGPLIPGESRELRKEVFVKADRVTVRRLFF